MTDPADDCGIPVDVLAGGSVGEPNFPAASQKRAKEGLLNPFATPLWAVRISDSLEASPVGDPADEPSTWIPILPGSALPHVPPLQGSPPSSNPVATVRPIDGDTLRSALPPSAPRELMALGADVAKRINTKATHFLCLQIHQRMPPLSSSMESAPSILATSARARVRILAIYDESDFHSSSSSGHPVGNPDEDER